MSTNARATCVNPACDCVPDGERTCCSDYCETQHVGDVIEVGACRCDHEGCVAAPRGA